MSQTKETTLSRDPVEKVRSAIETLERFNRVSDPHHYFHVSSVDETIDHEQIHHASVLQRTMTLAKSFISDLSGERKRPKKYQQLKEELLEAIGILRSHHYLLSYFSQSSDERMIQACKSYNQIIKTTKERPQSLQERIAHYFFDRPDHELELDVPQEIDLPVTQERSISLQEEELLPISERVSSLVEQIESYVETAVTFKEIDAFRVKAITLLRQENSFSSFEDIQKTIRKVPMKAFSDHSHINIKQTLSPFPGEVIILKGSFKRDPHNSTHSIPISDSFQLLSLVAQSGFPHALQHHGFALTDALFPCCPHRSDQLILVGPLLQAKEGAAKGLLPDQPLNNKAKKILKNKVLAFEENLEHFLELQKILIVAMIEASGRKVKKYLPKITAFFDSVKKHPTPYHYLAETNDIIVKNFIKKPFLKVQKCWIDRLESKFFHHDPAVVFENVKQKLIEGRRESFMEIKYLMTSTQSSIQKVLLDYVLNFGGLISDETVSIQCQILSEQMNFRPPMLSDFERKLQASAFKQQYDFISHLSNLDLVTDWKLLLENQLMFDVQLFRAQAFDSLADPCIECVQEIEDYFNSRYFSTLN